MAMLIQCPAGHPSREHFLSRGFTPLMEKPSWSGGVEIDTGFLVMPARRKNWWSRGLQPTTHAAQKFCSRLWKWIVGKTFGRA